ncbi:hypothetical protein Dimus_020927 [Dionaea muscipula]
MGEDELGNPSQEGGMTASYFDTEGDGDVEGEEEEGEEEDGDEGEEGEEDDIGEGECFVGFQNEMNPLDLIRDDASGSQVYKQFERLEYEALADRKRKALANKQSEGPCKKPRQEEVTGMTVEEMQEIMNYTGGRRRRRRSRKQKKRGRQKGSKKKLNPELTRKLGDATLHYAHGHYEEAISMLNEVVRLAPNLPDPYHTLGLIYEEVDDKRKATVCYMIAALLSPKDSSLWRRVVPWSIELGDIGQAWYCLHKAINADPGDITLKSYRAALFMDIGDYRKAAETYDEIFKLCPDNFEALKTAIMLYKKSGLLEHAVRILEGNIRDNDSEASLRMVDMLASLCIENKGYVEALQHIEDAKKFHCLERELPLSLTVKEGICYAHLGQMEKAEICFSSLHQDNAVDHMDHIIAVANTFMDLQHSGSALKYYLMLEGKFSDIGFLNLKMAHCYLALRRTGLAVEFFYKALQAREDDINTRLTLASVFLGEGKDDEAIYLLLPPANAGSGIDNDSIRSTAWWLNWKVKLKLSSIYRSKGMHEAFVDLICPLVRESLLIESMLQKVKQKKRLSTSILAERVKVLDDSQTDSVFRNFRRPATKSDMTKACRAKKILEKKATLKEGKKLAALAAGLDWESNDSDEEALELPVRESPLPELLKDEEHYCLMKDLCTALVSLRRYSEALDIIKLILMLSTKIFPSEKKEEFRSLGSEIALNVTDPSVASEYIRYMVRQHPQSIAAWNCFYKIFLRLESRHSKFSKFLHRMRVEHKYLVPPMMISGNQFTTISHHQAAAREYLEAYKLMPESSLINLCTGTSLINLSFGHRLQNKHHTVAQGLAFLYNNLRLHGETQEALYNIARAYHHVGLFTLAASYYEKVLAVEEKDGPLPELSKMKGHKTGCCDLRREAAYNLHLIYRKSGAVDLARQLLKDCCTL